MKNLILIGGTMGVGKTTVSLLLKRRLPRCVFLDGDWCWDADPFTVTDETKAMVEDNICHLLANFLRCSAYDNVVFCWVMHEQAIIDGLLGRLPLGGCRVTAVSLVCAETELARRLTFDVARGIRQPDIMSRSIARLPLYDALSTVRLDVTNLSPEQTADAVERLIAAAD